MFEKYKKSSNQGIKGQLRFMCQNDLLASIPDYLVSLSHN
jgi:hypothetical protein